MLSLLSSPPQLSLTRPSSPSPGSRHNTASTADCRASTALQRVAFGLTAASVSDKKGLQCSVRSAVIFLAGQYFKAISGEETVDCVWRARPATCLVNTAAFSHCP